LLGCKKNAGEGMNFTLLGNVWVKECKLIFTELIGVNAAVFAYSKDSLL